MVVSVHGAGEKEEDEEVRVEEVMSQVSSEGGWMLLHNIQVELHACYFMVHTHNDISKGLYSTFVCVCVSCSVALILPQ